MRTIASCRAWTRATVRGYICGYCVCMVGRGASQTDYHGHNPTPIQNPITQPIKPIPRFTADEILEKLQEVAEEFDAAMDTAPEPSALEK